MNDKRIWDFLIERIGNPCGVSGLMGNLFAESALNPRNLQQSFERRLGFTDDQYTEAVDSGTYSNFVHDGAGYGLAQWTYPTRKEKLLEFAKATGASIGDLNMQLEFLWRELQQSYSGTLKVICEAKSVRKASDAALTQFERPKDQSEAVMVKRAEYGQRYYDRYAEKAADEAKPNNGGDKMAVKIGSARIDENGKAKGGKAGDQTGKEVSTQSWYDQTDPKKAWRVFRAKDPDAAEKIAQDMQWACDNKHIGYDQGQRLTLYNVAKPLGFNCKKVTTNCETDCSALVRVCCAYAGIDLPNFRTTTEPNVLINSGAFEELKGDKYSHSSAYLKRGDILVTSKQGHTVVVLTNGSKAEAAPAVEGLSRGDHGSAVEAMQRLLLKWNAACLPKYGADGDFGEETEDAVKAFQKAVGLPVTGVYDETTRKELTGSKPLQQLVEVTGGTVNVRSGPGTTGTRVIGVVNKGDRLSYQGESRDISGTPWHLIEYRGTNAWISGKFSKVVS